MPKFLIEGTYTAEGMQGVISKGGSARRDGVRQTLEGLGGRLETFYFAFGEYDAYAVADLPDNITAAAVGMAVSASGMTRVRTVVLLTPEEVDQATQIQVAYRAPGT